MIKRRCLMSLMLLALIISDCCKRITVPPAIDLEQYGAIGLVEFTANAKGNIAEFTTQKFMQKLTEDQKGIPIIELGTQSDVLTAIGQTYFGPDAIKAIRDRFNVATVITGELDVSDVRPHVSIGVIFPLVSVSADVEANLTCRMQETVNGATIWLSASHAEREVGNVTIFSGFFSFDAEDPEEAYGKLVEPLVRETTKDFRNTSRCQ